MPDNFNYWSRFLVLKLIKIYQKTLSFDQGLMKIFFPNGYCKYQPTCSDYAYQAVEKYGVIKGGLMAFRRVLRCNPFSLGGHDPVK